MGKTPSDRQSTADLASIAPVVLAALALLLALLLRSLVAPLCLIAAGGFSYLAALDLASFVFLRLGGDSGINFAIPILLFIFAMALGEDYNILLMRRVREEAHDHPVREAQVRAVGRTGGTITSAGLILAGNFSVLAIAGNSNQACQLGFTVAFAGCWTPPSCVRCWCRRSPCSWAAGIGGRRRFRTR